MDTSLHRSSVSPAVPDDHVAVVYRVYLPLHVCAGPQAHFTEQGPRWRVRNLRMDHFYMYGSLTAIVVVMLWLYICICILLIGAEINYHEARYGSIFEKKRQ